MATVVISWLVAMAVFAYFSFRLVKSLEQMIEFWAKRDANRASIRIIIDFANSARREAFQAKLRGADLPEDLDAQLLLVISNAKMLEKRNEEAKELREVRVIQELIDRLNDDIVKSY